MPAGFQGIAWVALGIALAVAMTAPLQASATGAEATELRTCNATRVAQPSGSPEILYALIEIPSGSITKYEIDPATGFVLVDRFQSMPVVYPANYGMFPSTLAGDGDTLDALVYTREPVVPGALIRVRPIGVLKMTDGGEPDDKIVAVPIDDVDPAYAGVRDLLDLPDIERERLVAFFQTYKLLPKGRKQIEIEQLGGRDLALKAVAESLQRHRLANGEDQDCRVP